jgi:hypothetical protein
MRRRILVPAGLAPAGLALVAALTVMPVLSAVAAPASAALPSADPPPITWSVEPADAAGVEERDSLAYAVDPGTQIVDSIAVSNFGDAATTFQLYATDATNDFETGAFGLLPGDEQPSDVGSWITVADDEITVQPGARAIVSFTVLVPSDATPGDHTAGIVASFTTPSTDGNGQAVELEQRVGARVYLRVSGDAVAQVEATGLVAGFGPSWNPFGGGTATVDYAVSNTGNVRVDVDHDIVVHAFGIELATLHPEEVVNLLPGQSAHISLEAPGVAPLLLIWGVVTLKPGVPTDTVASSAEQKADGTPADPRPEVEFQAVTAETTTGAVSWTLLILLLLVIVGIWLVVRYVRATQDRMYEAIDEATVAARQAAVKEAGSESSGDEPTDARRETESVS